MLRKQHLIISLVISLMIIITVNIVYNSTKEKEICAFMVKQTVLKGEPIEENNLTRVYLKQSNVPEISLVSSEDIVNNLVASKQLNSGQILTKAELMQSTENNDEYEYISLLVEGAEQAVRV